MFVFLRELFERSNFSLALTMEDGGDIMRYLRNLTSYIQSYIALNGILNSFIRRSYASPPSLMILSDARVVRKILPRDK